MCTSHCVGHHRGCTALIMFIRQSVPESRCHPVDLSLRIFAACTLFPCQWSTFRCFVMPLPWNLSPSPYSRSLPERSTLTRTSSTQLSRLRCSVSAFPTTHPLPLTATSTASLHILTQASSPCWLRLFNWFEKGPWHCWQVEIFLGPGPGGPRGLVSIRTMDSRPKHPRPDRRQHWGVAQASFNNWLFIVC